MRLFPVSRRWHLDEEPVVVKGYDHLVIQFLMSVKLRIGSILLSRIHFILQKILKLFSENNFKKIIGIILIFILGIFLEIFLRNSFIISMRLIAVSDPEHLVFL